MRASKIFLKLTLSVILSLVFLAMASVPVMAQSITVSPASGEVDSKVSVSGSGFTAGLTFKAYFAYNTSYEIVKSGTVTTSGTISASFTVPEMPAGAYTILVRTSANSASGTFTVVPAIELDETSAFFGEKITVSGTGFDDDKKVTIKFDNDNVATDRTDDDGSFSGATFTVPEVQRGSYTVKVTDGTNTASTSLEVRQSVNITPDSGIVGATITVTGHAFKAKRSIKLTYDGAAISTNPSSVTTDSDGTFRATFNVPAGSDRIIEVKASDGTYSASATFTLLANIDMTPTSGEVGTQLAINGSGFSASKAVNIAFDNILVATSSTDRNGYFSITFSVPPSFSGTHTVKAMDGKITASAQFNTLASMVLEPAMGQINAEIQVSGHGFGANKLVSIQFADVTIRTAATDANGSFSDKFKVPQYDSGNYNIVVSDGINKLTSVFTLTVSASLSQTTGNIGENLTVTGSGFTGAVSIKYDDNTIASAIADANGAFSTTLSVPPSAHGHHIITVSGTISTIQLTFTVESDPPAAPIPIQPVNNARENSRPSFDWTAVTDPSGVTYTLQIATGPGFNNIILQREELTTSQCKLTNAEKLRSTSKEIPYYWRVKTVDRAQNESAWSESGSFYVSFLTDWVKYTLIGLGEAILLLFAFWLGMKIARRGASE